MASKDKDTTSSRRHIDYLDSTTLVDPAAWTLDDQRRAALHAEIVQVVYETLTERFGIALTHDDDDALKGRPMTRWESHERMVAEVLGRIADGMEQLVGRVERIERVLPLIARDTEFLEAFSSDDSPEPQADVSWTLIHLILYPNRRVPAPPARRNRRPQQITFEVHG